METLKSEHPGLPQIVLSALGGILCLGRAKRALIPHQCSFARDGSHGFNREERVQVS